ncbi:hypothetical protein IE077_004236 [Cardiosporidium cionae]|uniref:Fringe-like glycosyltransferase domain-containing protein n=1 Tax=Cardiosporidium cionae TaxID=476202 RepID=A0ABQ7JEC0_9APIC|nr:hypothetical protein IE077_004236 [Cardiosporidium cionae]|eukprot:KAF8821995.1 hypothetical protein IE077_004236 [Cardiosporidium cionae]
MVFPREEIVMPMETLPAQVEKSESFNIHRNEEEMAFPILRHKTMFLIANEPSIDTNLVFSLLKQLLEPPLSVSSQHMELMDFLLQHEETRDAFLILPWLLKFEAFLQEQTLFEWIFLCSAVTRLSPIRLEKVLSMFSGSSSILMLGKAMSDKLPVVPHSYFWESSFKYPFLHSGVAISSKLVIKLAKILKVSQEFYEGKIFLEPFHEMAKVIYTSLGVITTDVPEFCSSQAPLGKSDTIDALRSAEKCATWTATVDLPSRNFILDTYMNEQRYCGKSSSDQSLVASFSEKQCKQRAAFRPSDLVIAIKTTAKHHADRCGQISQLWASPSLLAKAVNDFGYPIEEEIELIFMSDMIDPQFNTRDLQVPPDKSGLCQKFYAIMKAFYDDYPEKLFLFIADDDTLVNVENLLRLLSATFQRKLLALQAYESLSQVEKETIAKGELQEIVGHSIRPHNSSWRMLTEGHLSPLYMGERYYFTSAGKFNYDYITSGGGTIFDRAAIELILQCEVCVCPKNTWIDDMTVGLWMSMLNVPALHYPGFHQFPPDQYSDNLLETFPPVTFHKLKESFSETRTIFNKFLLGPEESEKYNSNGKKTVEDGDVKHSSTLEVYTEL